MVRRRSGRRANATTGKCPTISLISDESDANNSLDAVSCSSTGTAKDDKGTATIDPYNLSQSKLEGLVSEKSLYVKVVDIKKSNSKTASGLNFNISSTKLDDKSPFKVQSEQSGENSVESVNIGSSMSSNRSKSVSVLSRVVTRSRRLTDNSNAVVDQVTTVGVIKSTRRTSKTTVKRKTVISGSIDEPTTDSSQSRDAESISENNVDVLKTGTISQTDDDDPCLSGDIMYEQIIIEDDTEESINAVILGNNSHMDIEREFCSRPSSTSDHNCSSRNEYSKEIDRIQAGDDSKVSSSSSISDNISCVNDIVSESVEINNVFSESNSSMMNVNVSTTESQNIKALSSLKLDPGVEPVSSSKTESYFQPIFSIEENSCGQAIMDVDLEETEIKVIEINDAVEENDCSNSAVPLRSSPNAKETILQVSTDIVSPKKTTSNKISFEKIVTRSRSGVNSSRPSSLTSSPTSSIKGRTKKKKSEIKDIDVPEITSIDSSSKNSENECMEVAIDKKPNSDNTKDPKNVLSDTNDSDTHLIVNRCITDETRKYMGPKGIIKNNYCSNVELNESMKSEASNNSSIVEIVNINTSPADIELSKNKSTEIPDNISLPNANDKNVPMSPKELFLKNYSSQLNLKNNIDVSNDKAGEVESIGNVNPVKSEEICTAELTIKNDAVEDTFDHFSSPISKNSAVSMNKTPLKTLEMIEQSVRRSRRCSADKAKRFISSLSASPKEKKEIATNKVQNSLDSNSLTEKSEKTNQEKQNSSVRGAEKLTPGKSPKPKPLDKPKKELVTMSSILNEKLKPMSPKELIKKSFIANEFKTMVPPNSDLIPERISFKPFPNQSSTDDNGNDVDKDKMSSSVVSCSTEQVQSDLSDSKKNEFVIDKGKYDLKADSSVSNSSLLSFDSDKPVKVKSRWRRTSELEMGKMVHSEPVDVDSSSRLSFGEDSKSETEVKPILTPEEEKLNNEAIVAQRMNSFIHIDSNEYLTDRYISKETKRMVCDCTVTKEEIAKGEKGCGEDCLNRLLLIECGSRCPLGKLCSNKCFVNREYSKCKVINMANKGMGVISAENISSDRFIMEYVGEVLDPKEFRKRAKDYSKEKIAHFYFMSLKADTVIDATHKGNISRFINHSCDPNAETQKWTVNGELRIGFFSKRPITVGEEITFDYQLERYGKEAQKCYCGSTNCRGWLGENPDNDESEESSSEESEDSSEEEMEEDVKVDKDKSEYQEKRLVTNKIKKDKKKLPVRRKEIRDTTFNPDGDLEDEIDKLTVTGVKNQKHTLDLCRLIVRATEERSRSRLLDLIKMAATPCLRLFLDYHGLNLLWSWMVDPRSNIQIKSMIMETLFILPIQNKTMLKDSKVLSIIEKWASFSDSKNSSDNKERGSTEEENSNSPREEGDDIKSKNFEKESRIQEDFINLDKINDSTLSEVKIDNEVEPLGGRSGIENQASKLLEDWANLKEEFRIPRKQRVEQMKEHERQADMEYSDPRENQSYNRRRFRDRKESRFDKIRESRFDSKKEDWNQWQNQQIGKMSKAERRQLFAERVKREEREKREAEELWKSHQEQCQALGVNPSQTAMFHPHLNALAFYHKESNCWMPYQEGAESYGGGDGGVVVDHHQPPPHYQIDYQSHLPPGGPGYYQQGYQHSFGQFNQALLFQPPPPPPPQQFNIPPLQQHLSQTLPPPHYQQSPLPQGQALLQQGYVLPPGPPLIQQGPPLLPQHGPPIPPLHGPPLSLQHCPPLLPQHGPPIPPPHGPQIPSTLPPQLCPLPSQSVPPLQPPQQGVSLPPPGHPNFFQGPPLQGPPPQQGLPPHQAVLPQTSPRPPVHPLPPQGAPPLPSQVLNIQPSSQKGVFPQESCNSMEVQVYPTEQLQISSVPLKLPPKWKTAKDKEGRLYYYHVKKRVSQWIFPYAAAAAAFNSEPTSDSSSDDSSLSSSEEEEDEEEEEEEDSSEIEQENTAPTLVQNDTEEMEQDVDGAVIKKRKSKKDDIESPVPVKKPKESSLVSTIIIPREEAAEMIGITKKKIRDNKEKVKREKARAARKQRQQIALQAQGIDYSSASVSSKCEADTSSGPKRKIKDIFMLKMANVVVASLNQYRKHDCKMGRITSTKDFKALAKKLTHFIMVKELRHCVNVEDLDCNENVKHKARDFIRKYMSKFGSVYVNPKED